ncbi:vacuolar protein-sorting-associated protein 36 isoform X3 [Hydra vulgaris]|uniref:Vacuolar protein-sorting-associated protein 36 n=1 Tax=Hydra vulgaris TaxID=6087 RepID=A0ABM4D4J4_HYDVU
MDRFYWLQKMDANERNVHSQNNVRIYDGDEMTTFDSGELTLTNLKLIWKDSVQKERTLGLDLSLVQKIDVESASLFKSPKVLVHLSSVLTNKPDGPKQKSQHNYIKLSFRSGGNEQFIKAFKNVLCSKDWEIINAAIDKPKEPVEISHRHVGIVGIERKIHEKHNKTDETVAQAFKDLDMLIEKAKDMVAIADKFSKKLQEKEISITDDETVAFKSYLLSMGIENPVTRESHGSGVRYHMELAKQLATFLQSIIEDSGGVMTLSDVFCRFNRARGMELVSPEDLVNAAKMMESLKLNMKLRKFDSGLLVIQSLSHTEEEIIATTTNKVKDAGSLTSEEFARFVGISLALAKERLLLAEKVGHLCRDDSVEGLRFFPNKFVMLET